MKMEQMGNADDNKVRLGNQMQMQLAKQHGEELDSFITKHSYDLRVVLDSNPNLLEEFNEDPDGTLEKVGKSIYH